MNSVSRWLVVALVAGLLLPGMRSEAADASVSADFASAYVYHGITYNDGLVFQPSVDVSSGHFGFNVWGNMDLGDYGDSLQSGEFSEVDLTPYWAATALGVDWCVSYAEYLYPHVATTNGEALAGSREVIVSADRPLPLGFTVGLKVHYDVDELNLHENDDLYIRLSLRYDRTLGKGVDMNATVMGSYADSGVAASQKSGLHDYGAKLGLEYQVFKALKLNGFIAYADTLDDDVLRSEDMDVNLYGSIGLSYAM